MTFDFKFVEKNSMEKILPELFRILYGNMSLIAPTGGTFKEDFAVWREYIIPAMQGEQRQIVMMLCDGELAGYFQYDICNDVFMMEEIQIKPEYQGTGLFRELYRKEQGTGEGRKRLTQADVTYYKLVERLLCDEFSLALGETWERVMERLYDAVSGRRG